MFLGGAKWPVYLCIGLLLLWMFVFHFVLMENRFQWADCLLTKVFYDIAMVFGLPPEHPYTIILSNTLVRHTYVGLLDTDPYIRAAVRNFWQLMIASVGTTILTAVLPILGYVEIAKKTRRCAAQGPPQARRNSAALRPIAQQHPGKQRTRSTSPRA